MRISALWLAATLVAAPALAQGGMGGGVGGMRGMGGGMDEGGMGGGGMGGHGGHGGRGGQRGEHGRPDGPPRPAKPLKRDELDKPVAEMIRLADANRDGIVTIAELRGVLDARREAAIHDRFKRLDTDHDGALSEAEFLAWQRSLGSLATSDEDAFGDDRGPVPEAIRPDRGGGAILRILAPLDALAITGADANHDGGVSAAELLAYERARFDRLDTDHDGWLTAEELRADRRGPGGPGGPPPPPAD